MMKYYFPITLLFLFFACTSHDKNQLPTPVLEDGIAKVTGHVINYSETDSLSFAIQLNNPIIAERNISKTQVESNGTFHFEIPVETSVALATLYCEELDRVFLIALSTKEETVVEFNAKDKQNLTLNIRQGINISNEDSNQFFATYSNMMAMPLSEKYDKLNKDTLLDFIQNPQEFARYHIKYDLNPRLDFIDRDTLLSSPIKDLLRHEMKSHYMIHLLTYPIIIFQYCDMLNITDDSIKSTIQSPPRSYYSFLKDYDLNNPLYLYTLSYRHLVQDLLSVDSLNLEPIEDKPIDKWLSQTKEKIADLIGFDSGLFYDILLINSFNKQFSDKFEPLSNIQKQNLRTYYKGGEVERIILRKNKEIAKLDNFFGEVVINKTPQVKKEKLMDAIVSKYKGKVVVVDFWATWCGPCLSGMQSFRNTKNKLNRESDNLVFVYITGESSPQLEWHKHIKKIDGEHYYVTDEEWNFLLDSFQFQSIPSFLLFDKKGALSNKGTGVQENERMKEMINDLLLKD